MELCTILAAIAPIEAVVSNDVAIEEVEVGDAEPEVPVAEATDPGLPVPEAAETAVPVCELPMLDDEHLQVMDVSPRKPHKNLTSNNKMMLGLVASQHCTSQHMNESYIFEDLLGSSTRYHC